MDELNRWARDDLRSLNAQIEFLLREAVRKRTRRDLETVPRPGSNVLPHNPPKKSPSPDEGEGQG